MSDLAELYRRLVLDHGRQPRNKRPPPAGAQRAEGHNPACGDRIVVHFRSDAGVLRDAGFDGSACVVCLAAASLLTEAVDGRNAAEARALADLMRRIVVDDPDAVLGARPELAVFRSIAKYPVRAGCALLPWETLERALASRV